jgi:hypothetical protein
MERREGARAYLDTNGSVRAAANFLARKYDDPFVNRGSVCAESPGIVFLIPERFDAEFRQIVTLIEKHGKETGQTVPKPNFQHVPGRFSATSSSGCPWPPDIDPNRRSAQVPPEARQVLAQSLLRDAESAFQQRVSLCEQQRGYLVPGGCASVCYGENRRPVMPVTPVQRTPQSYARQTDQPCRERPRPESRFNVGDINQADPALLVTAKILEGWDDCAKAKFGASIALLPLRFVVDKYRGLQTIATAFGYGASIPTLIAFPVEPRTSPTTSARWGAQPWWWVWSEMTKAAACS